MPSSSLAWHPRRRRCERDATATDRARQVLAARASFRSEKEKRNPGGSSGACGQGEQNRGARRAERCAGVAGFCSRTCESASSATGQHGRRFITSVLVHRPPGSEAWVETAGSERRAANVHSSGTWDNRGPHRSSVSSTTRAAVRRPDASPPRVSDPLGAAWVPNATCFVSSRTRAVPPPTRPEHASGADPVDAQRDIGAPCRRQRAQPSSAGSARRRKRDRRSHRRPGASLERRNRSASRNATSALRVVDNARTAGIRSACR
jgi:hypothetical protein